MDGRYAGYILIADEIKEDAAQAIRDLKQMGVEKTVMLTGDNEVVAQSVARQIGLDAFVAELLPEEKVYEIEKLLDRSGKAKLAFVGALLHKGYEIEGKISRFSPSIAVSIAMKTKPKPSYQVRNWSEYDAALKQRGSLTFWIDEAVIEGWINEQRSGRRGASKHYSDGAIALMATVQSLFNLPGRQTEGFLESLFALMGIDLPVPDHSTLSRRIGKVVVEMPVAPSEGAIHVVVDSTGVKVYGEGEWKVRQHGVDKRRTWRKLHVGVNEATGEILAAVASTNNVSDDDAFADVIDGIDEEIEQVSGDGAYDKRKCYDKIAARGAKPTIPPRKDAVRWEEEPDGPQKHPRNQVLERIDQVGRQQWKQESGYHRRSLAETTMFRFKTIFGATLRRRLFDNQAVELFLKCAALNRMIQLGKPNSCKVEI